MSTQKEFVWPSPRCWNQALDAQLKLMGFQQSTSDPCIYTTKTDSDGLFILAVNVDDINFCWQGSLSRRLLISRLISENVSC